MRSPGMVGGLSRVESGPAHDRFFHPGNPRKKTPSVVLNFSLGETSWFASEQRQAHMHAAEPASEQSPGGTQAAKLAVQTKGAFTPPSRSHRVRC